MQTQDFIQTVRSMSGYDIVMTMIKSIKNPITELSMNTYGYAKVVDDKIKCFGCAATNMICHLANINDISILEKTFDGLRIGSKVQSLYTGHMTASVVEAASRRKFNSRDIKELDQFISNFEQAIDYLRRGQLDEYNQFAKASDFATLVMPVWKKIDPPFHLPVLRSDYTDEQLDKYAILAEVQPRIRKN